MHTVVLNIYQAEVKNVTLIVSFLQQALGRSTNPGQIIRMFIKKITCGSLIDFAPIHGLHSGLHCLRFSLNG